MSKYKCEYRISLRDMTINGATKLTTLLHDFQECFAQFSNEHHLTGFDLNKKDLMWIVSNINIEMLNELPVWNKVITIELWFSEIKKLRAYMDFKIYSDEKLISQGDSSWFILNRKTRRPVAIEEYITPFGLEEEVVFGSHNVKLKTNIENFIKINEINFSVNFNDIDFNGHVNNISYVDWAIATLPVEILKKYKIKRYSVIFKQECFLNEQIKTELYQYENEFMAKIFKQDGTTACEINAYAELI